MRFKNILLLLGFFYCVSCNSDNPDSQNSKETQLDKPVEITLNQPKNLKAEDTTGIEEIIDDDFISRVLNKDLILANIQKVYQPTDIQEKLLQNKHDLNVKDTLVSFNAGADSIYYYKAVGNIIPLRLAIASGKLTIDKNLKTGIDKALFRQKFKAKLHADTLVVSDLEGGSVFTFFFRDNKLSKILYQTEYLD